MRRSSFNVSCDVCNIKCSLFLYRRVSSESFVVNKMRTQSSSHAILRLVVRFTSPTSCRLHTPSVYTGEASLGASCPLPICPSDSSRYSKTPRGSHEVFHMESGDVLRIPSPASCWRCTPEVCTRNAWLAASCGLSCASPRPLPAGLVATSGCYSPMQPGWPCLSGIARRAWLGASCPLPALHLARFHAGCIHLRCTPVKLRLGRPALCLSTL